MIEQYIDILVCPDCGHDLAYQRKKVRCTNCKRYFYHDDSFIDLLPSTPTTIAQPYSSLAHAYYLEQFTRSGEAIQTPSDSSWGKYQEFPVGYQVFVHQERLFSQRYWPNTRNVYCDVSAASGFYTFHAAKHFDRVIHGDINIEYLSYAREQAKKNRLTNILFIRMDYFSPPFKKRSLDYCSVTDSLLYYGWRADIEVIRQVQKSIKKNGALFFDLHFFKWYHHDSRIFEYKPEYLDRIRKAFPHVRFYGFGRVPTFLHPRSWLFHLFTRVFFWAPPIRILGIIQK